MSNYILKRLGKQKLLTLFASMLFFAATSFAQVKISGKVTDEKGAPVPGASVTIKNTTTGTTSNVDGTYQLFANLKPGKYFLVISAVGLKSAEQALNISSNSDYSLNAKLTTDPMGLDEVIVTGVSAGTTKKQLGSYISTVKSDELTKGATGNVLAALQGKTAGAQISQNNGDPAGGMSVRLRGISSVNSSSEPLYIVDGVIVNNSTNRVTNTQSGYDGTSFVGSVGQNRMVDINPADIDRIEVLNGAAAAAIYGSRANAGVVQIFTKKGKAGKPVITFSTSLINSSLRKKLDVNQSPTKFGGPTDGPAAQTQDILTPSLTNTTAVTRYDYQDYIFRKAMGTDNNLSISGGTDKTKYYLSGSYFYNQGIVKNTDYQRFNFRSNIDQTVNNWLSVGLGLNYINGMADEKPDGNSFYSPMNSVTIIGNFHNIWQRDALGNIQAVGERGRANPVSVIEDIKQKNATSRIISNLSLKLKPIRNLLVDYTMGIDNYSQTGTTYIPPFAYNVSTAFWGGGITLDPTQNGYASAATNNFFAINHDINATYNINITKDLGSVTQVGFSQQYEKNNFILAQGRGLAPFVQTVNGASTLLAGTDDRSEISISGVYVQQNFKFKNQLFLTGALRRDGSSVFGANQRNQVYKKLSLSYVFSSANFWNKLGLDKWWDLAKIRFAYGESGNLTGIGAYDRFNTYTSSSFISRTALNSSSRLANENVKPERQNETEFGVDLAFLRNRIGLTLNIYNKQVSDLLINRQVSPTSGFSSLLDNIGKLENRGFELVLNAMPVNKKTFTWNITAIYNHNRNKVINTGQPLILLSTNAGAPVSIIEGQPIGVFYGTYFATNGSPYVKQTNGLAGGGIILNAAGIPVQELGVQNSTLTVTPGRTAAGLPTGSVVRKIIGNPNPDYTATFTNEFTFKKFGLRIQIDRVGGVNVFNADFRTRQGVGNGKVAEMEDLGKIPRGYISATNGVYNIEEWRVDNGAYTKLRELSLSYNVGKCKFLQDFTISISGRNLYSWDKYIGYDPEVNAGGQSTILRGIDFGSVPIPRTFNIGINAKF